jgi:hypothetical protein
MAARLSTRKQWLVAFLGFFLVFGSWAFAAPFDGPADEVQHVIRAVGVVSGQIAPKPAVVIDGQGNPGMGAYQQVPGGLWQHASCWGFNPKASAACATPISGGPIESIPTSAGRYNPLYYAMVGLPLKLWPSWGGLVLARLISAALSAALLAFAFIMLVRWSRYGLMLAGLLAASTPMLSHLAGAVNPNGLEIASGIALFSAAIPLLLGPPRGSIKPLIWLAGISGALLAMLRSLGPVWVVFALAALLLPQSRQTLARLWRVRLVRRWTAGVAVALVLSVGWIVVMKTGAIVAPAHPKGYGLTTATMLYINYWGTTYLDGMVGVAGWFDISMPSPVYWLYIGLVGSTVVFALVVSGWADRWRFFVLFVGGVVVPGVMQVAEANAVGFIIGGRYMLPLLVGMPLLAAFILERRLLTARHARTFIRLFCLGLLPAHLVLLVFSMRRWQNGASLTGPNPFAGTWHPPTGSVAPVVLMLAGTVVLFWVFWTSPARIAALPDLEQPAQGADAAAPTVTTAGNGGRLLDPAGGAVGGHPGSNGKTTVGRGEDTESSEEPLPHALHPH